MDYQYILTEERDRVLHLTLNRPERRNALSQGLLKELFTALQDGEADDGVGCIVIKGAGSSFCSGLDYGDVLPEEEASSEKAEPTPLDVFLSTLRSSDPWALLWNLTKPVIAQVHGYCIAGANELALNCDVVIIAEDAQIGYPPVRATGSSPSHMWTYLVGPQWAKRMMLTGDPIDGKTAERIGLVLKAVPADKLEEEVLTLAGRIANIPLELLAPHKALINKVMGLMGHAVAQQMAFDTVAITHHSDARRKFNELAEKEGLRAALQHRDGPFGDYTARPRK